MLFILSLTAGVEAGMDLNPSNTKATFVQITRTQIFLKTIQTLSCWYSLVSVILQGFSHHFVLAKVATSSIRVKMSVNM